MQFHQRLYEVRKHAGMTQNDLAEKLNVSRQAVSRWEMGTAKPDFENLVAISKLFGVSVDYLLKGGEEEKTVSSELIQQIPSRKEKNSSGFWEKVGGIALILFLVMAVFFGIGSGDLINGLIVSGIILLALAVLIGIICGIVIIIREILKRSEIK